MRISDWSSDVCSSDLDARDHRGRINEHRLPAPDAERNDARKRPRGVWAGAAHLIVFVMPAKAGVSAPLRDPSLRWGDGSVLLCRKLRQDRLIPLHRWEFRETMPRAGLRPGQLRACLTLHDRATPPRTPQP